MKMVVIAPNAEQAAMAHPRGERTPWDIDWPSAHHLEITLSVTKLGPSAETEIRVVCADRAEGRNWGIKFY